MRHQHSLRGLALTSDCAAAAAAAVLLLLLAQLDESAEVDASIGTTKDVFEELLSHQLLLQMYGSISEVSLLIAGRAPVSWWPPDHLPCKSSIGGPTGSSTAARGPQSPTRAAAAAAAAGAPSAATQPGQQRGSASAIAAAAMEALAASTQGSHAAAAAAGASGAPDSSSSSSRLLVPLEEEVDLVAIKFQGAQVGLTVSGDGFSTEVAMAALTIDDLLVGGRNPGKAHMARSSIMWEQQPQAPTQPQQLGSPQQQQQQTAAAAAGAPPAAAAGVGGGAAAQPLVVDTGQDDVAVAFRTITDEGGDAEGDDDEFYDADEGVCWLGVRG